MSETKQSAEVAPETRMMKALSHPLRMRILDRLVARPASPSIIAAELGEPLGNVSYHVKILLQYEAIELVETRPVRGALEHIYRVVERPLLDDAQWAKLPSSLRKEVMNNTLNTLWDHLVEAARAGVLDDDHVHMSLTPLELDQKGHKEMTKLLATTLDRALEIQAASAGRRAELDGGDPEPTHRTDLAIFHYHRP